MTERVRRRVSKWDVKDVPVKFQIGTSQDNALFGKSSENINHRGSIQECNSPGNTADSAFKSDDNSKRPCLQPPENVAGHKDANVIRDFDGVSQNMQTRDGNGIYCRSTSPVRDGRRSRSRSHSPRRGWNTSHRSRSRSPPHGIRNRSKSPQHGLTNRSKSPLHGLKCDPEGWNEQIRGGSRVSLCNDFAKGRCRRGSQCRFIHEEINRYDARRHPGSIPRENRGNSHERGGSSGHPNSEGQGYSIDRVSHGRNSQMNNGSSDRCISFLKGNCYRGSSCRFIHENAIGDDHGTRERIQGNDTQSYPECGHRHEHYRNSSTPCRYFSMGNCRFGSNCRFSHGGAVHDRPGGGSVDYGVAHNIGNGDKSWTGPKWGDEVVDSTQGGGEGISLNYGTNHIANGKSDGPVAVWNQKPTWNDNIAADTGSADNRWGHNLVGEKKSGGPIWGEVADSANGTAGGWSMNDGRGHIAQSGWNNPTYHEPCLGQKLNNEAADNRTQRKSEDDRNLGDVNKLQGGSKWGDEAAESVNGSEKGKSVNDVRGCTTNSRSDDMGYTNQPKDPTWNDETADVEVKKSQWVNNGKSGQVGDNVENKSLDGTKWCDTAPDSKTTNVERRNDDEMIDTPFSLPMQRSLDNITHCSLDDQNKPRGDPTVSDKPSDQNVHRSPPRIKDGNSASMGVQSSRGHEELPTFRSTPARAERDQYPDMTNSEKTGSDIQDPPSLSHVTMFSQEQCSNQEVSGQRKHPTATMYPEGQHPVSMVMMHPDASNMDAQSQQTVSSPSPRVQSVALNGPTKVVPSLLQMVEKIKAGKIDPTISPMTSGVSTGNTVTSEQVAQISYLSASLAQIFGNSQQLPQLYATPNPTSPMPAAPCPNSREVGAPAGESSVLSNQYSWSQKQYNPVSGSMESSQISTLPPGFSENPIKKNSMSDHESKTTLQSIVLSSVAGETTGNSPKLEKVLHQQSNEAKHFHSVGNERSVHHAVKEHVNAHSGDANADVHKDEDKKCKDVKGMRVFKFALAGFVKEVLKPTWKEGLLTKEAHKTIVKKVVDKVIGSVDIIPQTQNKIDQYLAYSKTKLTKLVEAYLEKFLKG